MKEHLLRDMIPLKKSLHLKRLVSNFELEIPLAAKK
jgi:hypothetical protein